MEKENSQVQRILPKNFTVSDAEWYRGIHIHVPKGTTLRLSADLSIWKITTETDSDTDSLHIHHR